MVKNRILSHLTTGVRFDSFPTRCPCMLVGQSPKEGLSTIFTAWSHLHFSFCEFAIYFSKAVKKGLVKKVLACVDIIRRKVLQDDGFVLPVHIKNDSQGCFSDLIHSVFQSSGSKLRAKKDVAFLECTFTDLKHKCTFFSILKWTVGGKKN